MLPCGATLQELQLRLLFPGCFGDGLVHPDAGEGLVVSGGLSHVGIADAGYETCVRGNMEQRLPGYFVAS